MFETKFIIAGPFWRGIVSCHIRLLCNFLSENGTRHMFCLISYTFKNKAQVCTYNLVELVETPGVIFAHFLYENRYDEWEQ